MGRAVMETARDYPGARVSAAVVRHASTEPPPGDALRYTSDLSAALAASDVLLDFSRPEATAAALDACVAARKPMVIGVTGLSTELKQCIEQASLRIPLLLAPNMSLGVNLLLSLVHTAAQKLGEEFDVEIFETHHRHKQDAPSGTALALGEAVAAARGAALSDLAVWTRQGHTGARRSGSIGFAVIRGGDSAGEHTVMFAGDGERLELTHRAASRAAFARGALTAAIWLAGRPAGLYGMTEVLAQPSGA